MKSNNSCSVCGRRGEIRIRYCREFLCRSCFVKLFEKRVRKTIRLNKLLKFDDRIGVALSGGKDSTAVLYILNKFCRKMPKSRITAVTIDLGVRGYQKKCINSAINTCSDLGIEHHIYSFKEEFNTTLDEIVEKSRKLGDTAPACSYCGVLRRKLLNRKARELQLNKIATGHNLDDEVQSSLMNYIRGDLNRISRTGAVVGIIKDRNFIPRIKPLRECPEEEVLRYAEINGLKFRQEDCPHSTEAFRRTMRGIVDVIERKHPGSRFQILRSTDNLAGILRESARVGEINRCKKCGELTSKDICTACEMMEKLGIRPIN